METLQLPQDLYWGTKTEPLSPASDDQLFPSITLFSPKFETDDNAEDVFVDAETDELIENVLMHGEILLQLEICDDDDENGWDCPIDGANYPTNILQLPIAHLKETNNNSEGRTYSENADIISLSPQAFTTENFDFAINSCSYAEQPQPPLLPVQKIDCETFFCDLNFTTYQKSKEEFLNSPTPSSSSAYEESSESERGDEIVDEILRIHTKNLPDINDNDNDSQYSSSSFLSGSDDSSLYKNNSMSPTSNHDWPLSTTSDDQYSSQENLQKIKKKLNDDFDGIGQIVMKKRSRLYVRNSDEKKSRKKEQNKNAATRYRQKKKVEIKLDLDEERILLNKNTSLQKTVDDYQREVKYLKKLIREFYKK